MARRVPNPPSEKPRGGGAGAPPPPPPPPKTEAKKKAASQVYLDFIKAHPKLKPFAQIVSKWAAVYKVDPVFLASLLLHESGGNPNAVGDNGDSLGLGQINIPAHGGSQTPWGDTVTREWALNPNNNVRFAAFLLSRGLQRNGTYEGAYSGQGGYNPGHTGTSPFRFVPGTYVPTGKGLSPAESASVSVETAAAKQAITDPWVVFKNGKVKYVKGDEPPKNALTYDGLPVSRSQFLNARRQLEETWISYTGSRPNEKQVANYLNNGWSVYTLTKVLVNSDRFLQSPVYKKVNPGYKQAAQELLGEGEKMGSALIRQAVLNNWSGDDLQAHLRQQQGYVSSTEFKNRTASFTNVHQTIMGQPDEGGMRAVQEAAIKGWSLDQYANWLRSTEAYQYSPEYQSKALQFAEMLGLVTGKTPVLRPGGKPAEQSVLPADDPRIAGQGTVGGQGGLVAGSIG